MAMGRYLQAKEFYPTKVLSKATQIDKFTLGKNSQSGEMRLIKIIDVKGRRNVRVM
jgi:hypothetical protein